MHNRYIYDIDIKKFSNVSHGQYADHFKQGDVSLVEAKHKAHYLGVPFILKSIDDRGDLHIITHIISIDHRNIIEAAQSNAQYATELYVAPKLHTSHRDTSTGFVSGITEVGDSSMST